MCVCWRRTPPKRVSEFRGRDREMCAPQRYSQLCMCGRAAVHKSVACTGRERENLCMCCVCAWWPIWVGGGRMRAHTKCGCEGEPYYSPHHVIIIFAHISVKTNNIRCAAALLFSTTRRTPTHTSPHTENTLAQCVHVCAYCTHA